MTETFSSVGSDDILLTATSDFTLDGSDDGDDFLAMLAADSTADNTSLDFSMDFGLDTVGGLGEANTTGELAPQQQQQQQQQQPTYDTNTGTATTQTSVYAPDEIDGMAVGVYGGASELEQSVSSVEGDESHNRVGQFNTPLFMRNEGESPYMQSYARYESGRGRSASGATSASGSVWKTRIEAYETASVDVQAQIEAEELERKIAAEMRKMEMESILSAQRVNTNHSSSPFHVPRTTLPVRVSESLLATNDRFEKKREENRRAIERRRAKHEVERRAREQVAALSPSKHRDFSATGLVHQADVARHAIRKMKLTTHARETHSTRLVGEAAALSSESDKILRRLKSTPTARLKAQSERWDAKQKAKENRTYTPPPRCATHMTESAKLKIVDRTAAAEPPPRKKRIPPASARVEQLAGSRKEEGKRKKQEIQQKRNEWVGSMVALRPPGQQPY